jgi:hypothetical protein
VPARHSACLPLDLSQTARFQRTRGYTFGKRVAAPALAAPDADGHSGTNQVPVDDPRVWHVAMLALWLLTSCH